MPPFIVETPGALGSTGLSLHEVSWVVGIHGGVLLIVGPRIWKSFIAVLTSIVRSCLCT